MSNIPTLAEIEEVKTNMDTITEFVDSTEDTLTTSEGVEKATLTGVINSSDSAYLAGNSGASIVGTEDGSSVQEHIDALEENQQSGVIVFQTYALLTAYTPTTEQQTGSFKVANDSDSSLNGYYSWSTGTTYIKDADLVINEIGADNTSDAVSGSAVFNYVKHRYPLAILTTNVPAVSYFKFDFENLMIKLNLMYLQDGSGQWLPDAEIDITEDDRFLFWNDTDSTYYVSDNIVDNDFLEKTVFLLAAFRSGDYQVNYCGYTNYIGGANDDVVEKRMMLRGSAMNGDTTADNLIDFDFTNKLLTIPKTTYLYAGENGSYLAIQPATLALDASHRFIFVNLDTGLLTTSQATIDLSLLSSNVVLFAVINPDFKEVGFCVASTYKINNVVSGLGNIGVAESRRNNKCSITYNTGATPMLFDFENDVITIYSNTYLYGVGRSVVTITVDTDVELTSTSRYIYYIPSTDSFAALDSYTNTYDFNTEMYLIAIVNTLVDSVIYCAASEYIYNKSSSGEVIVSPYSDLGQDLKPLDIDEVVILGASISYGITSGYQTVMEEELARKGIKATVTMIATGGHTIQEALVDWEAVKGDRTDSKCLVVIHAIGNNVSTIRPYSTASEADLNDIVNTMEDLVSSVMSNGNIPLLVNTTFRNYGLTSVLNESVGSKPFNEAILIPKANELQPVMSYNSLPVIDLYELTRNLNTSIQQEYGIHYTSQGYNVLRRFIIDNIANRVLGYAPITVKRITDPSIPITSPQQSLVHFEINSTSKASNLIYGAHTMGLNTTTDTTISTLSGYEGQSLVIKTVGGAGINYNVNALDNGNTTISLGNDVVKNVFLYATGTTFTSIITINGFSAYQEVSIDIAGYRDTEDVDRISEYTVDDGTTTSFLDASNNNTGSHTVTLYATASAAGEISIKMKPATGSISAYMNGVMIKPL